MGNKQHAHSWSLAELMLKPGLVCKVSVPSVTTMLLSQISRHRLGTGRCQRKDQGQKQEGSSHEGSVELRKRPKMDMQKAAEMQDGT